MGREEGNAFQVIGAVQNAIIAGYADGGALRVPMRSTIFGGSIIP
jgi:hypothetical protein